MEWIWMPIQKDNNDGTHSPLISIYFLKDGAHFKTLSMEEKWTLFKVRRHLEFEEESSPKKDFEFIHNGRRVRILYFMYVSSFYKHNLFLINDFLQEGW
jgi:hypothetical protein